jgi:hypothetical protein
LHRPIRDELSVAEELHPVYPRPREDTISDSEAGLEQVAAVGKNQGVLGRAVDHLPGIRLDHLDVAVDLAGGIGQLQESTKESVLVRVGGRGTRADRVENVSRCTVLLTGSTRTSSHSSKGFVSGTGRCAMLLLP